MAPSLYFLWVNSRPTKASDELFVKWYTQEHVPDLVSHGASTRATFYRENFDIPGSTAKHHDRQWQGMNPDEPEHLYYLALYQSNFEDPLKSKEYLEIPVTSPFFPWQLHADSGSFDARNYELIQDYDPKGIGEGMLAATGPISP